MEIFCIFSITQKWISLPLGQTCGISIFWSHQKRKKSPFYSVKWRFFAYFPLPRNGYLFWGKLWDIHFLEPPEKQKISILQCKMEIFCIFSVTQKWISLPLGQTCRISIFWSHQKRKKSPFYSVKWRFFCIFSITQKWISLPLGQTCGISIFWSHQKSKKSPFYSVKWRFFAYFPFPRNGNQHRNFKNQWVFKKICKKISILHCKMEIFCFLLAPENGD